MERIKAILLVFFLPAFLVACGKSDLSRSDANEQIQGSKEILNLAKNIRLQDNALKNGVEQGIWFTSDRTITLSDKGSGVIAEISRDAITLPRAVGVDIEITGIAGVPKAEGIKEVQFNWGYRELPSLVKRFAIKGGDGTAIFRLFDDGWRLEGVDIKGASEPAEMSSAEKAEENADVQAEMERKEREAEAKRVAQEMRARRILESTTPTKVLRSYVFQSPGQFYSNRNLRKYEIKVTDVSIEATDSYERERQIMFRDIRDVSFWRTATAVDYLAVATNTNNSLVVNRTVVPDEFPQYVKAAIKDWWMRYGDLYESSNLR